MRAVRDHRKRSSAVLVALLGVVAVAAVINYGIHQSRQAHLQAVSRGGEITPPQPRGRTELGADVGVLRGAIEFANERRLVLEVSEGGPKRYVFGMAGATIRVNGKEGGVDDLHRGDIVGVLYKETEGELIAKMVLVTDTERR